MPKPFQESFAEWVADNRYDIAPDCGWENADKFEAAPTVDLSSSTTDNVTTHSDQA